MKATLLINLLFCVYLVHSFNGEMSYLRHPKLKVLSNEESGVSSEVRTRRQSQTEDKKIVCFYASWSILREAPYRFRPEDIDTKLCTHIVYGYARPELKEGILPYDTKPDIEENLWRRFAALKQSNPNIKVILAVGGIIEGSARFTKISADPKEREIFVKSAGSIMKEYGFDGLDISWVYPGFSEGSSTSDKENYVLLLKGLREEFGSDYLLSVTLPGLDGLIDAGYDIPEVLKYVDFLHIWAGAYHAATDPTVNHPSPLYNFPVDETTKLDNVDATFTSLLRRGIPPSKMILLIANYATYFLLDDPTQTDIGAPTKDEGENPEWRGGLNYNELCLKIVKEYWTVKRINESALGPYAYRDNEWVAWDDEIIIRQKALYALEKKLGGVGFWTVDMDDFRGVCHYVTYPLLRAAREVFLRPPSTSVSPQGGILPLTTTTEPQPFINQPYPTEIPPSPVTPTQENLSTFTQRLPKKTPSSNTAVKPDVNPIDPFNGNRIQDQFVTKDPNKGGQSYYSNRDIVFQNIQVWIINHFGQSTPTNG